jgi:DNA-binding transcriptional ArsR family regulator
MRTVTDRVGLVLFGKAKRAILSQLMANPDKRYFVRELARIADLTPSTLTRDLSALAHAGIILRTQEGRQVYYQANSSSPVFQDLRGLITKSFGIADVVRGMLSRVEDKVALAAIYGSVARSEHSSKSDVDLLIVGDVTSSDFADDLLKTEQTLGRSITPTIYSSSEFGSASHKNPFVRAILEKPMIFIIGDHNELKRLRQGSPKKSR